MTWRCDARDECLGPKHRAMTWLLSGAAFVIAIATTAGCSTLGSLFSRHGSQTTSGPQSQPPPGTPSPVRNSWPGLDDAPAAPRQPFQLVDQQPPPNDAPQINIFGELDGAPRMPVRRSGGEAGFQQHTYVDDGYDGDVAVDPKGQWLVFSSTRNSEHANIYLQKVDGVSVTQLTSDDADDAFPVFSPDGNKIAFCSTRAGNWDIYLMDADGKNVVQITNSPMQEIHPSFSPDGTRLVYCAMSKRSGQWELWTVNLLSAEKRMIGWGLFPSWSPARDKDQIAFQKARARGSRWFSLWTLELTDGEAGRITEVAVSANAAIVSPSWSPDGKQISFATIVAPIKTSDGKPIGQQDIWTVSADGANRHRITDGAAVCATPFWASNNRIYFVSDRGGTECIWSARAQSANPVSTAGIETREVSH